MQQLSQDIQEDLAARVESGGYQSVEELLRDALRALDEERGLEDRLLNALDGERIEVTPEYWEEQKRRFQRNS